MRLLGSAFAFFLAISPVAHAVQSDNAATESTRAPSAEVRLEAEKIISESFSREGFKSILLGHNLTPTSYTLKKGVATLGPYLVALGLSDSLTIGSSPWIEKSYNMHNLHMRYGKSMGSEARIAVQAGYFRTYDDEEEEKYRQESYNTQLIFSYDVSPVYTVHSVLSHSYFSIDDATYSLRMQPFSSDPNQVNVSVLNEARLTKNLGLNAEVGILGANYTYPYFHYAGSIVLQTSAWAFQAGISHSILIARDQYVTYENSKNGYYMIDAVHPEIQAQYFF